MRGKDFDVKQCPADLELVAMEVFLEPGSNIASVVLMGFACLIDITTQVFSKPAKLRKVRYESGPELSSRTLC